MSLTIKIRKHQLTNKTGQNVIIECSSVNKATYVLGNSDSTWYDVTNDTDGLNDLTVQIDKDETTRKLSERSATAQLSFTGDASNLIQEWLYSNNCSYLNYFDVEIVDTSCNYVFGLMQLKADNISYCDDDGCYFTLPLREADDKATQLKKYSIHDNWQKWYSEDGTKEHPTFEVAVFNTVPIVQAVKIGFIYFYTSLPAIGQILQLITDPDEDKVNNLGLGRFHAAPKVVDVLQNIASKVGLTLDTIFDAGNPENNDCLFIPYGGSYHTNFSINSSSPSKKHIWNNRYIRQFNEFLDDLCDLYNCYWEVTNDKLIIKPMSVKIDENSIDLVDYVENACYEFDLTKKPHYGRYQYSNDPTDAASSQIEILYNDIVDFDGDVDNPMLEGNLQKRFNFASTGFLHDKFGIDNIYEILISSKTVAIILLNILNIIALTVTVNPIMLFVIAGITTISLITLNQYVQDDRGTFGDGSYYKGIIRIQGSGAISVPRIIRWDSTTPMNKAKVVSQTPASIVNKAPNTVNYADQPFGTSIYEPLGTVYNYPLYFDANYEGNLYDKYHETTDNPFIVNIGHKLVTIEMQLCCELLAIIGIGESNERIVGKVVEIKMDTFMIVTQAIVSYKEMKVTLKGKILYR
jgi:hypothetical protein